MIRLNALNSEKKMEPQMDANHRKINANDVSVAQ